MATSPETTGPFDPHVARLCANNEHYADDGFDSSVPGAPALNLAIVICMDCRLDPLPLLGLANGDAHIIRNAGGVITDDVVRSLTLSQRALGTREIVLIHHTECGVQGIDEEAFRETLRDETGEVPAWSVESFDDVEADVRQSIDRLKRCPFLPHTDDITGFVYDVADGLLRPVT